METKKFYLTSEFWLMVLSNLVTVLTGALDYLPAAWVPTLMIIINAAYAVSRGLAKSGVPPQGSGDRRP